MTPSKKNNNNNKFELRLLNSKKKYTKILVWFIYKENVRVFFNNYNRITIQFYSEHKKC